MGYRQVGESGECSTNTPVFPPGEWTQVELPTESFGNPVDPTSGVLDVNKEGLQFKGGLKKQPLQNGNVRSAQP